MLLQSRVILAIQCSDPGDAATISSHLGVQPTRVEEHRPRVRQANGEMVVTPFYAWTLDSPTPAEEGDATARLLGLVELIRPFGERLVTLDPKWVRYIDICYRRTPQEPSGLTVEFA